MIQFNLASFRIDKRLSISDLAKKIKKPVRSISIMENRGSIKPSFLKQIEKCFGNCEQYIIKEKFN